MRCIFFILVFTVSWALSGCGYHLTSEAQAPSLIAGKTIAIPMWRNKSYRMNLEAIMTGSLVDEFTLLRGGMVVSDEAAELLLNGTIVNFTSTAVTYTSADLVREYRINMVVEATLTEKKSQKVLWKGTLSAGQDYPALNDPNLPNRIALQQNSEEAALREISRKIAQELYQKMSENF